MFASNEELQDIEALKMQYQYWDCWTGGRYDRIVNPYMDESYHQKHHKGMGFSVARKHFLEHMKYGQIIRSNAVTGYWEPVEE